MTPDGDVGRLSGMSSDVLDADDGRARVSRRPNAVNSTRQGRSGASLPGVGGHRAESGPFHSCPQCGYWLDDGAIALVDGVAATAAGSIALSPFMAQILALMLRKRGRTVSRAEIAMLLWGDSDGPENEFNAINVHLTRLRQRLRPIGWTVKCRASGSGWTVGPLAKGGGV